METCFLTIFISFLGLLLNIVKNVSTRNLDPETNDVPHILLLYVSLNDLVVRADVLHRICRYLALILLVTAQFQSLTLQVVQVGAFHAHGNENLILMVEASPSSTCEGKTSHI